MMPEPLWSADPVVAEAILNETIRQAEGLELIASENFVSDARSGSSGFCLHQ